jgi:DNA-binding transcriptional LysR family regulator
MEMVGRIRRVNLAAIDLNLLVALDAVLSEKNVTRAAARIGRSQPATSHALNRARALFEDPLLVRVRGALEPTARARQLAPRLHRILRELGAALDRHRDFDPAGVESVTIAATDYVGFVLLPHLFGLLRQVAPRLGVHIRTAEGVDALEPVRDGVVELALGTFPRVPAELRTEALFDDQFVCLRRQTHASADRPRGSRARRGPPRLTVQEFADAGHVLVVSPSSGQGPVDVALARVGRSRRVMAYVPHFLVAPGIVATTDLVLTTGRRIAEAFATARGLQIFAPPVALAPFAVAMVWHPRTEEDSVARWLRSIVREATSRLRAAEKGGRRRARHVSP